MPSTSASISTAPAATAPAATPASPAGGTTSATSDGDVAADFFQTLVALLGGQAPAKETATAVTSEPAKDAEDKTTQTDDALLIPTVALPVMPSVNVPITEPKQTSNELSQVEALLGEVSKSTSLTATLVGDTIDSAASNMDTKKDAAVSAPQVNFMMDGAQASAQTPSTDAPVTKQLHSPVGTPAWTHELNTQIAWLVDKGHQAASLRLSPEHLGPLEVRIDVHDSQATVWFGATHAETRAALEQSLPRLRELFAAQGLTLSDAGVFREAPRDQSRQSFRNGNNNSQSADEGNHAIVGVNARIGLLDTYA